MPNVFLVTGVYVGRIAKVAGPVGVYVHHDGKTAVLFEAEGEGKNADEVLRGVAMHVAAMKPTVANIEDVDPAAVKEAIARFEHVYQPTVDGRAAVWNLRHG